LSQGLRLALAQMRCQPGRLAENLAAHQAIIAEAITRGVDIVCFPEMSLTGYAEPARYPQAVVSLDSPLVADFARLTAGRTLTAIAGIVEANPAGRPFITSVVAQDGRVALAYRKVNVEGEELAWYSPSPDGRVGLFHSYGQTIGLAICADSDRPELFAAMAEKGARLAFLPAAPGLYGDRASRDWQASFDWWRGECLTLLAGYAAANHLVIAVATQAGATTDEDFPGGGFLFGPGGQLLAESGDWREGVLYAETPPLDAAGE
jgi:predicted amidohydrolase